MNRLDSSKLLYEKFKVNLDKQMHAVPGTGKHGESGKIIYIMIYEFKLTKVSCLSG
jgi:hypothetical protein